MQDHWYYCLTLDLGFMKIFKSMFYNPEYCQWSKLRVCFTDVGELPPLKRNANIYINTCTSLFWVWGSLALGQELPCIRHTYVCCTWQPDMTPSPPAHTMVFRAMLPHQLGWEQTECSTTGMAASCRMEGTLPTSVKRESEEGVWEFDIH